eukprot:gene10778-14473_t
MKPRFSFTPLKPSALKNTAFLNELNNEYEKENENEINPIICHPYVKLAYVFLTEPNSSRLAYFWSYLLAWLVMIRILCIGLESCDGPNQYHNRPDHSKAIKDIPTVWAIRVALSRSAGHLVLPLFFLMIFNITIGVFLYFIEPCFNVEKCPWQDLFDAAFYTIVTMTTTGYGNQVPSYESGRFVGCLVMIFGSLFLSMPLAIIGNEYDQALVDIGEIIRKKKEMKIKEEIELRKVLLKRISSTTNSIVVRNLLRKSVNNRMNSSSDDNASQSLVSISPHPSSYNLTSIEEELKLKQTKDLKQFKIDKQLVSSSLVMMTLEQLFLKIKELKSHMQFISRINPIILLKLCEIKAWLPKLSNHISIVVNQVEIIQIKHFQKTNHNDDNNGRRMALFNYRPSFIGSTLPMATPLNNSNNNKFNLNNNIITIPNNNHLLDEDQIERQQYLLKQDILRRFSDITSGVYPLTLQPIARNNDNSNNIRNDSNSSTSPLISRTKSNNSNELNQLNNDNENSELIDNVSVRPPMLSRGANHIRDSFVTTRQRHSLYNRLLSQIISRNDNTIDNDINNINNNANNNNNNKVRIRSHTEEFIAQMQIISEDPTSLKSKIWILLEIHNSSIAARILQFILISLIFVSIFMLFTQTLTDFSHYGEDTRICGEVVKLYCEDKFDITLDPGCYIHSLQPFNTTQPKILTNEKLLFNCDNNNCFGYGLNFGSHNTNITCSNTIQAPFQSYEQLAYHYGLPYVFSSRAKMHRINPICTRIECQTSKNILNGNDFWIPGEIFINMIFTIELILRAIVSRSLLSFLSDKMILLDIIAVVPFYIELFLRIGSIDELNFAILASSPEPIFNVIMRSLKVFRMFKLTRHFHASKVLLETANKVWKQIASMICFLAFLTILCAIIIYQVEVGQACYVGDPGCVVPENIAYYVHIGDRIQVNKDHLGTQFGNVFFGIWFSFVTLTTT